MSTDIAKMIIPTTIHVLVNGSNFPHVDHHSVKEGESGCYFTVSVLDYQVVQSSVVISNSCPTWGSVEIDISGMKTDVIWNVEVFWDGNLFGSCLVRLGCLLNADGKFVVPLKGGFSEDANLVFDLLNEEKQDVNVYRSLNNAFLFSFPEHANDMAADEEHICDFVHDLERTMKLKNDPLITVEGVVDKTKMFFASLWNSLVHCSQVGYPIYKISVYHDRQDPFVSQFITHVIAIRIGFGAEQTDNVITDVGNVLRGDHILFSVKDINDNFADKAGFEAEHAELISATRYRGFRFSPVSIIFVYRFKDDAEPSYYLVETGTGIGNNTGSVYWGGEFGVELKSEIGFKPTPFTSRYNYYHHTAHHTGRDPTDLTIHAHQPEKDHPYLSVYIQYERLDDPEDPNHTIEKAQMISPAEGTLEALERIYTLADGFGCLSPHDLPGIALAKAGRRQEWITQPPVHLAPKPEETAEGGNCQVM